MTHGIEENESCHGSAEHWAHGAAASDPDRLSMSRRATIGALPLSLSLSFRPRGDRQATPSTLVGQAGSPSADATTSVVTQAPCVCGAAVWCAVDHRADDGVA